MMVLMINEKIIMNSPLLIHPNGGGAPHHQGARKKVPKGVFTNIDV